MNLLPRSVLIGYSLSTLIAVSHAQAQSDASSTPEQEGHITEIVVTATKREQNLNDVGLTVTALSGEALAAQGISDVADLSQITPGLTFAPSPSATPVYTIRGVGFFESTLAAYPDVSLYVDQAPLPFPVMATHVLFDLERVEVLKGPQGTLFGNNATGGAINFIAAKPTKEFEAGVDLSYGRFNTIEVNAFASGPLTEALAARLAVRTENGDEWQKSYTRDDETGKKDNLAARLIFDFAPTDALTLSLNVSGWKDQDDTIVPKKIAVSPQNPPGAVGFGGTVPANLPLFLYPNAPKDAREADWTPDLPFSDSEIWQTALRADWDINAYLTLTSITSYADMDFLNGTEGGGTALYDLDLSRDAGTIKSFSQEVRLASDPRERFRWVLGANYEDSSVDETTFVRYLNTSSEPVNGISDNAVVSRQDMENYAGFANVEFDVSDMVTLKGGLRQTKAERESLNETRDDPNLPVLGLYSLQEFFNLVYGAIGPAFGTVIPPVGPYQSISLDTRTNADGTPVDPSTYLTPAVFRGKIDEDSTSFSVGIDFKPTDTSLIYANIARGYKAGSFPHVSAAIFDAYEPVKQESLLDYEIGFKQQLADGRVQLNAAAFYYEYKDKQLRAKFIDPLFGALDKLVNVPKSEIKGAELEITASPLMGLTLSASGTYLNAEVKSYDGVIGSVLGTNGLRQPVLASFNGVDLPFAPKFQYTVRADYDFSVSGNLNAFFGIGLNGQSKSIGILTVSGAERDLYEIKARELVNVNAGIRAADDKWRASVWGRNIFDTDYWTNTIQAYDTIVRYPGRPAEYGVSVAFRF